MAVGRIAGVSLTVLFSGMLALELFLRCGFPWDTFLWPESPFMTDMWKLDRGQPVFGPPADANSFVYSPGLLHLTWSLLRPFGLHLDLRCCRGVVIVMGIAAAWVAAAVARRAAADALGRRPDAAASWVMTGLSLLLVFRNLNADVPHPDNLLLLAAGAVFALALRASRTGAPASAVSAAVLAGAAFVAKQTAVWIWAFAAAAGALNVTGGVFRRMVPAAAGLAVLAMSAGWIWSDADGRFWTCEVLQAQPLELQRLLNVEVFLPPHRCALIALAGLSWGAWSAPHLRGPRNTWLVFGAIAIPGCTASYLKIGGTWNSLVPLDLWLLWGAAPALAAAFAATPSEPGDSPAESAGPARAPGRPEMAFPLRAGLVPALLALLTLVPRKLPPSPDMWAHFEEFERMVAADQRAGRRVLVAHSTIVPLQAGASAVPLDRQNSFLEMYGAGRSDRAGTADRLRSGYYDRIYADGKMEWYGPEINSLISKHYRQVGRIAAPDGDPAGNYLLFGYQGLMSEVRILERLADPAPGSAARDRTR